MGKEQAGALPLGRAELNPLITLPPLGTEPVDRALSIRMSVTYGIVLLLSIISMTLLGMVTGAAGNAERVPLTDGSTTTKSATIASAAPGPSTRFGLTAALFGERVLVLYMATPLST